MKIAFFGLGAMGAPMAEHLLSAGHCVYAAVHCRREAAEDLQRRCGLQLTPAPAEAVRRAEVVLTILSADREVKEVLLSRDMAAAIQPGTVILEMSSCTAEAVQEVAAFYRGRGVPVVDAPVSGGVLGAEKGTLTVFASGDEAAQARVEPILKAFARTIYHLGQCGMGKTFKNLDNLLSMYNLMGLCEIYRIAEKQQIDPQLFYKVIGQNSGASRALANRWLPLTRGEFQPGFTLRMARKDVENALALGRGLPLPMFGLLLQLMTAAQRHDGEDVNAMRRLFE